MKSVDLTPILQTLPFQLDSASEMARKLCIAGSSCPRETQVAEHRLPQSHVGRKLSWIIRAIGSGLHNSFLGDWGAERRWTLGKLRLGPTRHEDLSPRGQPFAGADAPTELASVER